MKVIGDNRVNGGLTEGGKRKERTYEGGDVEVLVQQLVGGTTNWGNVRSEEEEFERLKLAI